MASQVGGLLAALALLTPAPAKAARFSLNSRSELSFESLPSWPLRYDQQRRLGRDRMLERLDLIGDQLFSKRGPRLQLSLRLGTDLGFRPGEAEALDGVRRHQAEALLATLAWQLPHTGLELEAGRILDLESVQLRYYDGASLREALGPFQVRLFGGQAVKEGSLLSSSNFEADGVRSSDAALQGRIDAEAWPYRLSSAHAAPTLLLGAEAGAHAPSVGRLMVGVEEQRSQGSIDLAQLSGRGIARLGRLQLRAAMAYDLVHARLSVLQARLLFAPRPRLRATGHRDSPRLGQQKHAEQRDGLLPPPRARRGFGGVGLELESTTPIFDGDSIWNLFVLAPTDRLGLFWRSPNFSGLRLHLQAQLTRFRDPTVRSDRLAYGARLRAVYRRGRFGVLARLSGDGGFGGRLLLALLQTKLRLSPKLLVQLDAAAGLVQDAFRGAGPFASLKGGGLYRFDSSAAAGVSVELGNSPLSALDVRVYATLQLGLDVFWTGESRP